MKKIESKEEQMIAGYDLAVAIRHFQRQNPAITLTPHIEELISSLMVYGDPYEEGLLKRNVDSA